MTKVIWKIWSKLKCCNLSYLFPSSLKKPWRWEVIKWSNYFITRPWHETNLVAFLLQVNYTRFLKSLISPDNRIQGVASPVGHSSRRVCAGGIGRDIHRTIISFRHSKLRRFTFPNKTIRRFWKWHRFMGHVMGGKFYHLPAQLQESYISNYRLPLLFQTRLSWRTEVANCFIHRLNAKVPPSMPRRRGES